MDRRVIERIFSEVTEIRKMDIPGGRVGPSVQWEGYQLILPKVRLYCDPRKIYVWHVGGECDSGLTEEEASALYAMVEEKYSSFAETRRANFLREFGFLS